MENSAMTVNWTQENDRALAYLRTVHYCNAFNIRNWEDVYNIVDLEYWKRIAADSSLGGKFTFEECYQRFVYMVEKYQSLRSLPRIERISHHNYWHVYKYMHWYFKDVQRKHNNEELPL